FVVGEDQVPVFVVVQSPLKVVGEPHRDVGVGQDAKVPLGVDEIDNVGVPDVENEHQRASAGTALLHQPRRRGIQLAPAHGARALAVYALHVGEARPQGGQVDADAAAPGHDLHHIAQSV